MFAGPARGYLPPAGTGHFYVSNHNGDRVAVFDAAGMYLRSFSAPGLNGPRGVVVHPASGQMYVAGQLIPSGIYVFDAGEHHITTFTHPELNSPTGMALSSAGELYVASYNNDKVVVFDLEGNWQRSITHADINGTNCVAFDSQGYYYVACAINDKVVKFAPDDTYVETFSWPGHADSAMGLARDGADNLYVAGGNSHDILKFSTDGTELGVIEHPDLTGPQGVAFDDRGHLFSSSFYQHKVVEFDADGNHVQTITGGNLQIPRSIAFAAVFSADLNGDGTVDGADLALLLGSWGPCPLPADCPADLDHDGIVDAGDLAILLGSWG